MTCEDSAPPTNKSISLSFLPFVFLPTSHSSVALSISSLRPHRISIFHSHSDSRIRLQFRSIPIGLSNSFSQSTSDGMARGSLRARTQLPGTCTPRDGSFSGSSLSDLPTPLIPGRAQPRPTLPAPPSRRPPPPPSSRTLLRSLSKSATLLNPIPPQPILSCQSKMT